MKGIYTVGPGSALLEMRDMSSRGLLLGGGVCRRGKCGSHDTPNIDFCVPLTIEISGFNQRV